jgi:sugar lactone lactonase YvrE
MKMELGILAAALACLSLAAHAQLSNPKNLVFDSAGNLWVANQNSNQVLELNPSNGTVLNTITQGLSEPQALAYVSPYLYVSNVSGNNVTVYNTTTLALVNTFSNGISFPTAVAVDVYGDVYVGNNQANAVVALRADGTLAETLTQDNSGFPFTAPGALAVSGQDIYVGLGSDDSPDAVISYNVGEFLTGDPTEVLYIGPNDGLDGGPNQITIVPVGKYAGIYVSYGYSNDVVRWTFTGVKKQLFNNSAYCGGVAVDKSGNVYVANRNLDTITVFNSSGQVINTLN